MRSLRQRPNSLDGFLVESLEGRVLLSALPAGWSDNDVGSPPLAGSVNYNMTANTFAVSGSGSGVGGTADQFNYTNYAMTGDGSITALLTSLTNTDPAAKAGVMIRSDTTAGSLFAAVDQTAANTVAFEWRSGSTASISSTVTLSGSIWLRVNDQGNNFTGYYSTDGMNWTQIGNTQSLSIPSATVFSGLWASSNNSSALNTAQFSDVSLVRGGWGDADIGAPPIGGAAVYDSPSDTTTIWGNGADIYTAPDQFNFDSTTMTGNGSAIAYVDSITNTNAWAKAGVMIRNDSTAGSAFTALFVSPTNGITFEYRLTASGTTNQEVSSPAGGPTPAPVGLKLTRGTGNVFSAFYSTDGINWISVGASQTVALNTTALAGLAVTSHNTSALCTAAFSSVSIGSSPPPGAGIYSSTDQLFLNNLENAEVLAFYDEANASTGLVPDNENASGGNDSAYSSIAAIGFGLSSLTIGDARGWLSHSIAYQRALTTINFLYNSGANNNGFFYHFLAANGSRYGTSEVSSVDTAELMAGVLNVAQYWAGTPLQTTALAMFNRVNWPWMQQSSGVFYGAWIPGSGFSGGYGDYSEASLLYLIALGSPTHPISEASWLAWTRTPVESYAGYTYVDADDNALFTVQEPQAWFNLQGLTDTKGLSYYTNAQTATLAQRQWMINLSSSYSDYGPNLWGLTPAEGVSGYTIWGGPPANVPVNGTVVPAASGGSLEFEPRDSVNVLENMKQTYGSTVYQKYGLVDAFNPLTSWTSPLVLGIDIGMMLLSAENSRSNLVWNSFDQSAVAQESLAKAFPTASTSAVWTVTGSGNWNSSSNWENSVTPNSVGAAAEFFGTNGTSYSIYSDVPVTAGTLNFVNADTYVIDGAGSLTLQVASGSAQVNVQQGTQVIDLPMTIASNTVFNIAAGAALIIANPMTINSGITLTQGGGGTITYNSIITLQSGASIAFSNSTTAGGLDLQDSSTASMTLNTTDTPMLLQLDSLSIAGRLDVANNDLIVDSGNLSGITNELKAGFNAGDGYWNGATGILSTAAAADSRHLMTLGTRQSDGSSFDGVPTTTGDVLVKYTYFGDANLDGMVNGADYQQIDNGFGDHLTGWQNGDFNYDGVIDGSDFSLIDNAFNQLNASSAVAGAQPAAILAAVSKPEKKTTSNSANIQMAAQTSSSGSSIGANANAPDNSASALIDLSADDPRKHHNPTCDP